MKICILSQQHFTNKHVSEDTVDAFETAILLYKGADSIKVPLSEFIFKANRKIAVKLNTRWGATDKKTIREINKLDPEIVFVMAMSPGT